MLGSSRGHNRLAPSEVRVAHTDWNMRLYGRMPNTYTRFNWNFWPGCSSVSYEEVSEHQGKSRARQNSSAHEVTITNMSEKFCVNVRPQLRGTGFDACS